MKTPMKRMGLTFLALLTLCITMLVIPGAASTGTVVKSDLTGPWQISLRGNTGCGFSTMLANVSLASTGAGSGTLSTHGQCGDSSLSGQSFTIKTLTATGSGTAGLSCGTGCGWTFNIQVSPDRSKITLVDVNKANPNNYLEGEAVRSSPDGDIVKQDLAGSWQVTLLGLGGCGTGSAQVTFTLDSTASTTNATSVSHSAGCGDTSSSGNTFTVSSLNSNGSGIAGLSCGAGCGFTFAIQVSPDREVFNLVDMTDPANYLAGIAVRTSGSGFIAPANLAGNWLLTLYGQGGCGNGASMVTFTLNANGVATNAVEISHNAGCGNTKSIGNTFTIQSLNPNGSGTAGLSCGASCGFKLAIQVSPDRSTFNVVDVTDPSNYLVGKAVHQ